MAKPRNPNVTPGPAAPADRTAMIDMAAAFGHGARKGNRLTWSLGAIEEGEAFMAARLAKPKKPYWEVRGEALRLAYIVGRWAATYAEAGGYAEIQREHVVAALGHLGPPAPHILREPCPF